MLHKLLPLLLVASLPALCQIQSPVFTGRVIDAHTQQSVPYAALRLRAEHSGTLANTNGHFILDAPKQSGTDTLMVEAPGYQLQSVVVRNQVLADSTILLSKLDLKSILPSSLPAPGKLLLLGAKKKEPAAGMMQGLTGTQFALLMQAPQHKELGSIRMASFFIGENGEPKALFRIRIYRANGPGHSPGTNLLAENVVARATGGGQWYSVDLSAYHLDANNEDFFVAMEWLNGAGIRNYCKAGFTDPSTPCGQILRPTFEFKDSLTWQYIMGKGWQPLALKLNDGRTYNAMIKAEVELLP